MSSKEKQAKSKRRLKIKDSDEAYQSYLKNDRERKQAQRSASKGAMSTSQLEEHRVKERQRIREYRLKKKMESQPKATCSPLTLTPYRSTQARGKAIKRAQLSLPLSPRKRQCVVESLAKTVGLKVNASPTSTPHNHGALSEETKQLVHAFYNSNDTSWQAPGRKDRIIIRETSGDGTKIKRTEQLRYMLLSLREAHHKFTEENTNSNIGLSKFCELRPKNVKLFDHIPHHVCVCSYHENVRLLLVALKEHTALSIDFKSFVSQVTCDPSLKDCMSSKCTKCKDLIDTFTPSNSDDTLKYQQWQSDEKVEKVDIIATVGDAFAELKKKLHFFLIHTYVKRRQAACMVDLISKCDKENGVLQVDFSENATIMSQNETQSAHWNHGQATLFTAHAWTGDGKGKSFVLVSDVLTHTKESVWVFMNYLLKQLREDTPSLNVLNIFSDGAGSQFKQKYLFSNLYSWEQDYSLSIKWNFFATSHGKGVVDGIGGTVKRAVWRHVKSGQVHVTSAEQYAVVAAERSPNIHVHFISKADIQELEPFLDARWKNVVAVPRTRQMHCFIANGSDKVMVADTSDSTKFTTVPIRKVDDSDSNEESEDESDNESDNEEDDQTKSQDDTVTPLEGSETSAEDLSVGKWVVVNYDGERFPGEIASCTNEIEVSVMHKSGNKYWKWPNSIDKIFYERKDVLRTIDPPKVAGHRGQWVFDNEL